MMKCRKFQQDISKYDIKEIYINYSKLPVKIKSNKIKSIILDAIKIFFKIA